MTGSSIENLSKLANQAKISGVEFATLETLVNRMAAGMGGADEQTTKVKMALAALGVAAKDPAEAVFEVAKKLDQYADGVNKAALAREIFGKGGPAFLAMLKDLADAHTVAATHTKEQTAEAEKLQQALRRLSVESTTLRDALLSGVVPALEGTLTAFNNARASGLGFWAALLGPTDQGGAQDKLDAWSAELAKKQKEIAATERDMYPFKSERLESLNAEAAAIEKKVAAYQKLAGIYAQANLGDVSWLNDRKKEAPGLPPEAKLPKVAVADYAAEIQKLNDEMLKLSGGGGGYAHLIAANEQYQKDLQAGKQINADQVQALMKTAVAADELTKQTKEWDETMKAALERAKQEQEALEKFTAKQKEEAESIKALVSSLDEQTRTMFMSNDERERAIALAKLQTDYDKGLIPTEGALAEAVASVGAAFDKRNAALGLKKSLDEQEAAWKKTYDDISNTITDALMRGFEHGKDWAQNFIDTLKSMFGTLVLRPIIQAVISPVAGGLAGLFPGTAGASGGAGGLLSGASSLSSLWNAFSGGTSNTMASLAMSGGGSALGLSTTGSYLAGTAGGAGAFGLAGTEAAGAISSSSMLTGVGSAMVAAAPWLAIGAIAIPIIMSLIKKGGGPKVGGYAGSGDISGAPGTDYLTRSSSGAEQDAASLKLTQTTLDSYNTLVKTLGGSGTAGFRSAFSTDPKGTASNIVYQQAYVGGKQVYSVNTGEGAGALGRDPAVMQARMELEAKRALLAALQASDLPADMARILNAVSAVSATSDDVDKILAVATAIGTINTQIANLDPTKLNDMLDGLTSKTAMDVFRAQGDALDRLVENYDGTTAATQALTQASSQYYSTAVALLQQIREVSNALDTMFAGTRESIFLSGRDNSFQYDYYRKQADTLTTNIGSESDPAKIAEEAKQVNELIGKAWGLLDEGSKGALRDQFLQGIDKVNTAADTRLAELGTTVQSAAKSDLESVKDVLAAIADKMGVAADKIDGGGDKILAAANTPGGVSSPRESGLAETANKAPARWVSSASTV